MAKQSYDMFDYNVHGTDISNKLRKLLHSNLIYRADEIEWLTKFNRFGLLDYNNRLDGSKEYVFFTKPDLNIFQSSEFYLTEEIRQNSTILVDMQQSERYKNVLKQLQASISSDSPFMNILSNSIQNTVDLPGISSENMETASTIYGSKINYRKHSYKSDEGHEVTIEFDDTKYLEVYALFKAWDEYSRMRSIGLITAKDDYVENQILDGHISIYKFIVAKDYTTILFYAKLTGCYPTSAPREVFSELGDNNPIYSIPFKTTWVEDMDPVIITEFNTLVGNRTIDEIPLYDNEIHGANGDWAKFPYIVEEYNGNNKVYKLKWSA